jgi:YidC/Oxa1 family membrane protein insertase
MGQQFLIKRTVNDAKIRAKLDENKVKNATKKPGKFAGRLQDALRQAEEAKKLQQQLKERPKKDGKGGK